jgi:hypothetical protein
MIKRFRQKTLLVLSIGLLLLISTVAGLAQIRRAYAASSVSINGGTTYQTINGFGMGDCACPFVGDI